MTRPQSGDAGAAAFAAGAGLALFDRILRGGAPGADVSTKDPGEPPYAGCLRQRLALKAAEACATLSRLPRLREDGGALRDAQHLAMGGEMSPAGRLHGLFRLYPRALRGGDLARGAALLGLSRRAASAAAGDDEKALAQGVSHYRSSSKELDPQASITFAISSVEKHATGWSLSMAAACSPSAPSLSTPLRTTPTTRVRKPLRLT